MIRTKKELIIGIDFLLYQFNHKGLNKIYDNLLSKINEDPKIES